MNRLEYRRWSLTAKLTMTFLIMSFTINCLAQFGGGRGTQNNPWIIKTPEHLNAIRNYLGEEHNNKYYIQKADIDLDVFPFNRGEGWQPIGVSEEDSFQGHYDGNGHIIENLTIRRTGGYQALFGNLINGSVIKLGLKNVNVYGENAAGLIGYMDGNSIVQYCYVTGKVEGRGKYIGGIVSITNGIEARVFDCYSTVNMYYRGGGKSFFIGGMIGFVGYASKIRRGYYTGFVRTSWVNPRQYSPAIGANSGSQIYWDRDVIGRPIDISGMSIDAHPGRRGHKTSELLRQSTYEGFDFENVWRIDEGTSYPYLQWEGSQAGEHNLPRLIPPFSLTASGRGSVINLKWEAPESITGLPDGYNVYRDNKKINTLPVQELSYMDINVTDWTSYSYEITALYNNVESSPSQNVWVYPTPQVPDSVKLQIFTKGSGTEEDPFQISNAEQLNKIRNFLNLHYIQTAHIDLGVFPWTRREGWNPIGDEKNMFKGGYNGNGYIINNLTINSRQQNLGLFGVTHSAVLENINLRNVIITGNSNVGALCGKSDFSTVKNCSASGKVSASDRSFVYNMGGLIGSFSGSIYDSHSNVEVTAPRGDRIGGLIGYSNAREKRRCRAAGNVTGRRKVGGLAGEEINGMSLENYATGNVTGDDMVGGLYGLIQTASYYDSYAIGDVTGKNRVGGFVGQISIHTQVISCYSIGKVTGETNTGGFAGILAAVERSSSSTSNVILYQPEVCYWNVETSEQTESPGGGEPRDTFRMTYPNITQTYVGWRFNIVWKHDRTKQVNNGYPYLHYQD